MTTIDTITDEQIEALCREAGERGDTEMVRTCEIAMTGRGEAQEVALRLVVRAIRDAEAQDDICPVAHTA